MKLKRTKPFNDWRPSLVGLATLALLVRVLCLPPVAPAMGFYVSPQGSDIADGRSPKAAFRTLHKARDSVRATLAVGMPEDVRVNLLDGSHVLTSALVLTVADSGYDGHRVIWSNHPGHAPTVSGGVCVPADSWGEATVNGRSAWTSTVEGLPDGARVLIVNGQRRPRARSRLMVPRGYHPDRKQGFLLDESDVGGLKALHGLELHHTVTWRHYVAPVESIARRDGGLCEVFAPMIGVASGMGSVGIDDHQPVWFENNVALMDEPGEWFFERESATLYYLPLPGESLETIDAVLPQLPRLVEIRGESLANKAHGIAFEGITFAHGGWNDINNTGWAAHDTGYVYPRNDLAGGASLPHVFVTRAHDVAFSDCTFEHMGGVGLCLGNGVSTSKVVGCVFKDISASGLFLGAAVGGDYVEGPEETPRELVVANNLFFRTGQEFRETAAIVSGLGYNCRITHNHIQDLPYMGIVIRRFEPCPRDEAGPSGHWLVAHNRVENVMKRLSDGGAIYTWQASSGDGSRSRMVGNYLTLSHGAPGGLYLDWNCGFWDVSENVVDRTPHYWLQGRGHHTTISGNFTDNAKMEAARRNAYGWVVTNNTIDTSADWSRYPDAAGTVARAGLEAAYRHLRNALPSVPATNAVPVVEVWAATNRISLLETVQLGGRVGDDGVPWGVSQISWRTVSGPGDATLFGYRHTLLHPWVAFSAPGDYVVRLEVSDGELVGHADVAVTVEPVDLTENLALGKPTSESVPGERVVPRNAVDGDPSTFWYPGVPGRGWLQIDLGAEFSVCLIQLLQHPKGAGGDAMFTIRGSNDPAFSWGDVLGTQGPDAFESRLPHHQAVWSLPVATEKSYRYIRWEKTRGCSGSVTELRVFAEAGCRDDSGL